MFSADGYKWVNQSAPLMNISFQMAPGEIHRIRREFTGRIKDVAPPNSPGPYRGIAEVDSRVHMLNRPFDRVSVVFTGVICLHTCLTSRPTVCF